MVEVVRPVRRIAPLAALAMLLTATGCTFNFNITALPHDAAGTDVTDMGPAMDAQDVQADTPLDTADVQDVPRDIPQDIPQDMVLPDVPCGGACTAMQMCCNNTCVDTQNNRTNCGACGNACPGTICAAGSCTSVCALGFGNCDGNMVNGCEVDFATSHDHCGSCTTVCAAEEVCTGGTCACAPGTLDCDGNPATICESNINTDDAHCGNCMTHCGLGQSCMGGMCMCSTGLADCNGMTADGCEISTQTSHDNCGACGHACQANEECSGGMCTCRPGRVRCPADAVDCNTSATDPDNCGGCGVVCTATQVCSATGGTASCGSTCVGSICNRECVNLTTDTRNCGVCGNACTANEVCGMRGTSTLCVCSPGFADCNSMMPDGCEVNTLTDTANCGACGNACAAGQICNNGTCQCPSGLRDCGGGVCAACCDDNQCSDGSPCTTDTCTGGTCQHAGCGAGTTCCGSLACRECCSDTDCSGRPGNLGCAPNGTCTTCAQGYADCNNDMTDGCEARLDTTANCGRCGNACTYPNGVAECTMGACRLASCTGSFQNCDGNAANGCESNTQSSVSNCGTCGHVCTATAPASPTCAAGVCGSITCPTGFGECDGVSTPPSMMCEANLAGDVNNCGSCGNTCTFTNASAMCSSGMCAMGACNTGFGDCDFVASTGCETNTQSDVTNCGNCGIACSFPHARASCSGGICRLGACDAGFANCNGSPSDGCETNLASPDSCGSCTNRCPARANSTRTCTAGSCGFSCIAPFSDCNSSGTDGCETNISAQTTCGWSPSPGSCRTVNCAIFGTATMCTNAFCGSPTHYGCSNGVCP